MHWHIPNYLDKSRVQQTSAFSSHSPSMCRRTCSVIGRQASNCPGSTDTTRPDAWTLLSRVSPVPSRNFHFGATKGLLAPPFRAPEGKQLSAMPQNVRCRLCSVILVASTALMVLRIRKHGKRPETSSPSGSAFAFSTNYGTDSTSTQRGSCLSSYRRSQGIAPKRRNFKQANLDRPITSV